MESSKVKTNENKSAADGVPPFIPSWINEEHFTEVFQDDYPGLSNILEFEPELTGGSGENYVSVMMRVKAKLEVEGGSTKDVAYMIKIIPQGEQAAQMINMMGVFPKEILMYNNILPEFEEIYQNVGKKVTFAPKFRKFKKNPGAEYVLLEDLSPRGFKNINRVQGLDREHTESALRLLADFHAASAVRYEIKGMYDETLLKGTFSEEFRPMFDAMFDSFKYIFGECFSKIKMPAKCLQKTEILTNDFVNLLMEYSKPDLDDFNVINHGDLWANNIMFRYNDEGKLMETIFVDFQMSRYASPAVDLFYLLLSSTNLELKVSKFDYFVKYYHDHLVENLKLLNYSKKIPSLKDLRMQLLKNSFLAYSTITGIMAAVLLDPTSDASMEGFLQDGEDATRFKMKMFTNPRYIRHMEAILPWMDTFGLLDV